MFLREYWREKIWKYFRVVLTRSLVGCLRREHMKYWMSKVSFNPWNQMKNHFRFYWEDSKLPHRIKEMTKKHVSVEMGWAAIGETREDWNVTARDAKAGSVRVPMPGLWGIVVGDLALARQVAGIVGSEPCWACSWQHLHPDISPLFRHRRRRNILTLSRSSEFL